MMEFNLYSMVEGTVRFYHAPTHISVLITKETWVDMDRPVTIRVEIEGLIR